MTRIGIDARLYFQTGVGVYLRNFLHYLEELDTKQYEFFIYIMRSDSHRITFSKKNFVIQEVDYHWHSAGEQIGFLKRLNTDKLDLMHFTYFSYPILYKKKFIATIHDTIILDHKTGIASTRNPIVYEIKHRASQLAFRSQMKYASEVIVPSNTVKHHLIDIFGDTFASKIKVLYEGLNYEFINVVENKELEKTFGDEFFIYVGNFYPHKNVEKLLQAFRNIDGKYKLVMIGPDDYFAKRLENKVRESGLQEKIMFYHVNRLEDFVYFYRRAKALIHPSLAEGFGLPLIEAAYFNLPIIAADTDIFREILGDNFLPFNPYESSDITLKINGFLQKRFKPDYGDLLKKYSFKNMSEQILELYKKNV